MTSNRIRHPLSLEVTLAIVATKFNVNDLEEATHETLNRILGDRPEEVRAEVYSRIVENMPGDGIMLSFVDLQHVVSEALWDSLYV